MSDNTVGKQTILNKIIIELLIPVQIICIIFQLSKQYYHVRSTYNVNFKLLIHKHQYYN